MMPRILITGKNSFIGQNFIGYSKFRNVEEVSLLDFTPDSIGFAKYDVVIHLAAIVHQTKKISEYEYFRINKDLCLTVANLAKRNGVKQFIFLSSVKVYGKVHADFALNEETPCNPTDPYGRSKLEAELGLLKLNDDTFRAAIIRTPIVYGPGVKANMLELIKLIDKFSVIPLGGISNQRSFIYVENLISYIDRIIEKNAGGIFLTKDLKSLSTTEVVFLIAKYLNKKSYIYKLPNIVWKIIAIFLPGVYSRLFTSLEFDNTKTLNFLDFSPPFNSEHGIKMTVQWYKNKYLS